MRFVIYSHSLRSCWNHGNAHFLRGIASELLHRGHEVAVYEPQDGWSLRSLVRDHGFSPLRGFQAAYPLLRSQTYQLENLDLDQQLDGAEIVLVHEWNPPELVARIGAHRERTRSYRLFLHDTHHRTISAPAALAAHDLRGYDGVLAFGKLIRDIYLHRGWAAQAWTWHQAADTRVFRPLRATPFAEDAPARPLDVVWIGNWGDEERTPELFELLFDPVRELRVQADVWGVRYPPAALQELQRRCIRYHGWLPNYEVPQVFASARVTVHVPRRQYTRRLAGIPTIRPFEALACGIPLVSGPWNDAERLFREGVDYLKVTSGAEMQQALRAVLNEPALAQALVDNGRQTIAARHTCAHRVDELLAIYRLLEHSGRPRQRGVARHERGDGSQTLTRG